MKRKKSAQVRLSYKLKMILLSFIFIIFILFVINGLYEKFSVAKNIKYGVSYSSDFATFLGLDWKKTYTDTLDELKIKNIRLTSYWTTLEKEEGKFDFSETDFLVSEASKRGASIILVVGTRQPRWPECYVPEWAKKLDVKERQSQVLNLITKVVEKYKDNPNIRAWQVENEPLLQAFGAGCDKPDEKFLKSEVDLVKSLDNRPVIVTDSGELGNWVFPMKISDIFGTTIYRMVYNDFIGDTQYYYPSSFYNLKSKIIRLIFAPKNQKTIAIEVQAEPWSPENNLKDTPFDKQIKRFSRKRFEENVDFSKKTGFDEIYLWGVEWWYWMKQKGYPEYWEYAKTLF